MALLEAPFMHKEPNTEAGLGQAYVAGGNAKGRTTRNGLLKVASSVSSSSASLGKQTDSTS